MAEAWELVPLYTCFFDLVLMDSPIYFVREETHVSH
jgi:hypothetical protein